MELSWIVLMTVLQAVMLTTLAATSVNPVETTNNYRQVKAHGRASDHRSGQLQVLAQVSTDRIFTRQPKSQKRADYRRPSPTVNASVQRRQQQQLQQQQQQQYGSEMSHLEWTPIVQPKGPLQKDYQQRQVRQPDAVVTFVTPPPPPLPTTTHYNDEPNPKNHVQHLDDESDEFRNRYRYVNASELSEGYNNKLRNVTRITNNAYGAVDEYRKNSNFDFHDGVLENNKTRSQNSYINNGVNGAKGQNALSPQDVYNVERESDEENNERTPQSNHLDFQLNSGRNAMHRIVNTDVLLLQLQADENNKQYGQVDGVNHVDQRTQIRYGDSQHLHLLDGESKSSDVLRDYQSNTTTAAAYPMKIIDQENSHAEVYDNNIVYNTDDDVANEQRLNHNESVDDRSNDFYRDNNPKYANANGEVDGRGNGTHYDYATVHTDSSKAQKHEDGGKYYVNNLKLDLQDAPKNKQRVGSNRHANRNVTALEADSHVVTYKRPRGHNDERGEIEHRRRQKPSVNGGRAEVNLAIPTTTSARPLRRKSQSSAQTRRPAVEDDENDDGKGGRTLYRGGQNGHERKHNLNDRGRITTPSDKQPSSVMTTSLAHVIEQDVVDGDDDYIGAEEELEQAEQGGYGFGYTVLDENVGMDFGQWERREPGRTGTVTGLYRVRLPDGRTQTVKYTVSPATGYRASVTYEGVQRHPAATPSPRLVEGVERYPQVTRCVQCVLCKSAGYKVRPMAHHRSTQRSGLENLNDRGRITTPSDKQPSSVMTTSLAHVIEQDVVDGDDDYIGAEEELEQAEQGGYGFGYTVLDENVGMDFGQWERREPGRTGTVTGLYRVRLPDGRTQTVKYTVSPATGYRASVTYEGVQRHPAATPSPRLVEGVERYDSTRAETRSPE